MAKGGRSPDDYDKAKQTRGEDIVSGAKSLMATEDFSHGYPETFDPNMHINRGSPANGGPRGRDRK